MINAMNNERVREKAAEVESGEVGGGGKWEGCRLTLAFWLA